MSPPLQSQQKSITNEKHKVYMIQQRSRDEKRKWQYRKQTVYEKMGICDVDNNNQSVNSTLLLLLLPRRASDLRLSEDDRITDCDNCPYDLMRRRFIPDTYELPYDPDR